MQHRKFEDWKPSGVQCDRTIEIAQDPAGYLERNPGAWPFADAAEDALTDPRAQLLNEMMAMMERIDRQLEAAHAAGEPEAVLRALYKAKCRTLDTWEAMWDAQCARRAAARSTDKEAAA